MATRKSEWEDTLENLQAVLHTFNSPNTEYTDLLDNNSDVIQISILHPTHLDTTLEATISQTNSSPTISVKSNNPIVSRQLDRINKDIQTHVFSSLMEACLETFELINQRMDLKQNTNEMELNSEIDSLRHYVVMKIDHMHDEKKYLKHVQDFSKQTGVHVLLIITKNISFILLTEDTRAIDQFLYLMRTVNVDVDRKRRPCKERLMKILEQDKSGDIAIPGRTMGIVRMYRHLSREEISTELSNYNLPLHIISYMF